MNAGALFMPHQRYIANVAGELDPATVTDNGRGGLTGNLYYDTVVLIVPRQNGKTWLLEAVLVSYTRRRDRRRIAIYTAQDRQMARDRLLIELEEEKLAGSPFRNTYRARRSNGSESIKWNADRSRIVVAANTDEAGHGMTVDLAVLDEAFSHDDLTVVNALQPTTLTRPDPQMWIVSTIGDGSDGLLQHYQEVARLSLDDPDTRVAAFEWSATDQDDRYDPAVWRRVMPALGHTITEERVRSYSRTTPIEEWDRAYLCRRAGAANLVGLDVEAWSCAGADLEDPTAFAPNPGPLVAAFDIAVDRSEAYLAVAGAWPDGRVAVVVDRRPGTRWVADALLELAHRSGYSLVDTLADRRAGTGGMIDAARARGLDVTELNAGDVASACGSIHDALTGDLDLVHGRQVYLDDAVSGSRRRPLGEAWAFAKLESGPTIPALVAVTFAYSGFRRHYAAGLNPGSIR